MNRLLLRILPVVAALMCSVAAYATLSDARALLQQHKYSAALQVALETISTAPKSTDVPKLQAIAGEANIGLGNLSQAREWFNKAKAKNPDAYLGLARVDMLQYNFEAAHENYSKYKGHEGETGREQAALAMDFLDHVQQVAVVDTICVTTDAFFEAYEMAPGAGKLMKPIDGADGKVVFCNEADDLRLYAKSGKKGKLQLVRSDRLADGSWEETPLSFGDGTTASFDMDFPYLMADGVTLYLAHNGPGGIGGYDIYIANGDPLPEQFMNPANLGMPFNSPANDYMMVVDEETGLGWWATDRNHPDGELVTIYIFAPTEMRVNYPADADDIKSYAKGQLWIEDAEATERYKSLDSE